MTEPTAISDDVIHKVSCVIDAAIYNNEYEGNWLAEVGSCGRVM